MTVTNAQEFWIRAETKKGFSILLSLLAKIARGLLPKLVMLTVTRRGSENLELFLCWEVLNSGEELLCCGRVSQLGIMLQLQ